MKSEADQESEIVSREKRIFAELPVPKAVAIMVIPTIISQIITVVYNLADTWYVGMTNNAAAVAAISLCLPVYNIMTAIANLFGIGGTSVITRAMAAGHYHRARRAFVLAVRGALIITAVYSVILALFAKPFFALHRWRCGKYRFCGVLYNDYNGYRRHSYGIVRSLCPFNPMYGASEDCKYRYYSGGSIEFGIGSTVHVCSSPGWL